MKLEQRVLRAETAELRVLDDEPTTISGYAAVFGRESEDLGGFWEVIRPGAFADVLRTADVRALFNHDANVLLGRTRSGTLVLEEDAVGLRFEIKVPDTQYVRDLVVEPIRRGDIDGCSFAFRIAENGDSWRRQEDGRHVREIVSVAELRDIGPVVYPAYAATSVAVRSTREVYDSHLARLRAQERANAIAAGRALRQRELDML